ncbi:uncharacterized protein LOC123015436 isoform X2 [Tribolium madens]|uniref:uncharacterized protein LOC123015436 isoform X2 n=1 Tax=Tribolium madens TaxID=41895 RepID=UPI001CF75514|nr:uncharacterized protein LOC123015436 isoform X2 [Tribolium madens]
MSTKQRVRQLESCSREMFGDMILHHQTPPQQSVFGEIIQAVPVTLSIRKSSMESPSNKYTDYEKRRASDLVEELLVDIYSNINGSDYNSATSSKSHRSFVAEINNLQGKDATELLSLISYLECHVERAGSILVRQLKRRDALRRQQDAHSDVITSQLLKRSGPDGPEMRFSIQPGPGESGFSQWLAAMKMVAQLSGGIPLEFRKRLWLTLADRHLAARGIDWSNVERNCFSEWSHPTDSELGVQIVKDLHRTGCSLFCGKDGKENQALLKRVLLAYARWNKAVGYCQGFNMLAALILQVTDKCETDALKLMIYLIEGVLPDSYFADSLRGLSVDMAVFRELLRARLPRLSKHLDALQNAAKEGTTSYEPPLTNVFTMQWFLTLFCNCLPQPTVLRVWDLILLEGNEILLRTALAIWQTLADRIMGVRSADEFYCIMGALTRELLEFELIDANSLIKTVVAIGPLNELKSLREHYLYNINPWGSAVPTTIFPDSIDKQMKLYAKDRLVLDISALKKQYAKLKQRQRQAHIIFSAAISRQPPPSTPVAMNHLLLGKSALVPAKRLGPPKGSIPPARTPPSTLLWKDAPKTSDSSSSSDTELCDDPSEASSDEEDEEIKSQFVDDNPENLMNKDNKAVAEEVDVANSSNSQISSDIFDNSASTSVKDIFDVAESDDDSVDFEKFLEDRVRCLKEIKTPTNEEPEEEDRITYGRRNSERALQIIQENSLILHRIMQCQSRLSPPPPFVNQDNASEATIASPKDKEATSMTFYDTLSSINLNSSPTHETEHWPSTTNNDAVKQETKSLEYGSRYSSILEKSRNLDEKYNNLILNASVMNLRTVKDENDSSDSRLDDPIISSVVNFDKISENSLDKANDEESKSEIQNIVNVKDNFSLNFDEGSTCYNPISAKYSYLKSPCSDGSDKSPSSKSPNKIFNPFPIPLNSRQSKEVPLKLGLYKK